jgi:AmiR/NasT family two-component response regulator
MNAPNSPEPKSSSLRVLIVEDDTLVSVGLKSQLEAIGHSVVGRAADAAEARTLFATLPADLVLLDIRLKEADGLELAREFRQLRHVPMIIVSAYGEPQLIARATEAGVFGYLIKPVSPQSLQAQIEVAVGRFHESEKLRQENEALTTTLETRKLVERAKGIFMKRLHLDEQEAHRRLQQESQKRRVPLAELAKKIIESEELLGGS